MVFETFFPSSTLALGCLDRNAYGTRGYTTYDRYGTFARYDTGALPLVIAIRTGADVEVVRALIEAYPAALRAYSGDHESFEFPQPKLATSGIEDLRNL